VKIDLEQIKVLLDMVGKTDIAELTIEVEGEKVTIKKPVSGTGVSTAFSESVMQHAANAAVRESQAVQVAAGNLPPAKNANVESNGSAENLVAITAPMVGTFYRASSPTASPYASAGDKISVGQTVCIIEAMKLMNDLPSEVAGRVVKVCAENGATVEFGQQLFLIDPAG
jgi:oxaloacetate decarboxylase (Na+ extruding) subunit alpha